jgi:hypothetical protein
VSLAFLEFLVFVVFLWWMDPSVESIGGKQKADVEVRRADERWLGELMGRGGEGKVVRFRKPW